MAKKNNLWLWLAGAGVAYYLYSKSQAAPANAAVTPGTASPVANAMQNLTAGISTALTAVTAPLKQLIASPVVSQLPAPPIPQTQTVSVPVQQAVAQITAPLISTVNDASGNPIVILPTMPDTNYLMFENKNYPGANNAIAGMREMGGC